MGKRYLIDTNVISHFLSKNLSEEGMKLVASIIDEEFNISVITQIEILAPSQNLLSKESQIKELVSFANILPLDEDIANEVVTLRNKYSQLRKKIADASIAATALKHDLILLINNTSDFQNIKGLKAIDPRSL
ncbi:type II toxin-antitoxin system VapC family toxin [Flectobacillus longus]|uniref:type II toxin-antitoxin system VapC family toxin n=1 Tax=Flectobacillus longus TaxID=2984207 RepID=UPI0024B8377B|nr:type II toxin-antitoxin system VapC family toxin [Flectobacillus longus]MDI9878345.1 type II toxin-antitoxin system VapC family toxin [Flectobacillus longus]